MLPDVEKIMAYEEGSLSEEETLQLFQQLVDSGMAWTLQGDYGRQAQRFIQQGLVRLPGVPLTDTLHQYQPGKPCEQCLTGYGRTVDKELDEEKLKERQEALQRLEEAFHNGVIHGFW